MNVRKIVMKYLKDNGYDGLVDEHCECGCLLSNLMPCDYGTMFDCQPGYKGPGDEQAPWYVYKFKPAI